MKLHFTMIYILGYNKYYCKYQLREILGLILGLGFVKGI